MKRIIIFYITCIFLFGIMTGQIIKKPIQNKVLKQQIKPLLPDFEIRNIKAPKFIYCGDLYLTLSVEVWNVGNRDYDPARGQAVLYGDLFDAETNAPIAFGTVPMDKIIKKGQFQKWTFSFTRSGMHPSGKPNFENAKKLKNLFIADEQGVTGDPDYSNNLGYTGIISTNCKMRRLYRQFYSPGVKLFPRNLRTKKR